MTYEDGELFHALIAVAERSSGKQRKSAAAEALEIALNDKPLGLSEHLLSRLAKIVPLVPMRKQNIDNLFDLVSREAEARRDWRAGFADLLTQLACHVPESRLGEVKSLAGTIKDPRHRFGVLRALARREPGDAGRQSRYAELIAALRAIPEDKDKWDAITETAADVPPHLLPELFDIATQTAPDASTGKGEAVAALVAACGTVSWSSREHAGVALRDLLHGLSRPGLLVLIEQSAPLISAQGDGNTPRDVAAAVREVLRWWP